MCGERCGEWKTTYVRLLTRGTNPEVDAAKIAKLRKDAGLDAKIVVSGTNTRTAARA